MWTPDQVIRADTIHTMDPSQPRAEWMAIHHGKIVATGLGEPARRSRKGPWARDNRAGI